MNKTTRALMLTAGACLVGVSAAQAQTADPRIFLIVNVGAQAHSHTVSGSGSFTAFEETGTFASSQGVNGGMLFDLGVAYRLRPNIAIAVGASRVADETTGVVTAEVPHPIFFDRLRAAEASIDGLDRQEVGIHFQLMYFLNAGFLPEGSRLALTVGPSIFRVRQDLVTAIEVVPTPPAANPVINPIFEKDSATAVGVNVGFDFSYPVAERIDVGAFVRYAGGSFEWPSGDGDRAGGFQGGGGLRIGF